ncbi:MAG: DNA polymerase III subunit gamma/tau [Chitinophagaceae bacterium]|nr:DNA polymerase III subunit gamma/tau [Chitinophagaceae bacterium]
MEKFIVSARKYRPQTFDTIVGQSHITTTLKNAIVHQQLAHAFLFCGPRGVGKTTCARILAKTINCENPSKTGEACDQCESCTSYNAGKSLNYFELDGASNNSVDDIRDLVAQVRYVPQSGKYKVYVIDEVHMLSSSAFNAFLKTLEEPPPYAIFILATTEKHKILPTILSRCQLFDFKRIATEEIVGHLEKICKLEKIKAEKAALQIIAQKCDGCLRDALSILDKIVSFTNGELNYNNTLEHLNILDEDYYFQFLECMQQQDLSGAMLLFNDINQKGFEGDIVLNGMAGFIRNLLVSQDKNAAILLDVVDNQREKYIQTAAKTDTGLLISALNILSAAEIGYKTTGNKRLLVELTLIKLCYLQQAVELSATDASLSKKKIIETAKPVAFRKIQPIVRNTGKEPKEKLSTKETPAKLIIATEKKPAKENNIPAKEENTGQPASRKKLKSLQHLRQQIIDEQDKTSKKNNEPLLKENLDKAWAAYLKDLKNSKSHSTLSFESAQVRIIDANSFEIMTANSLEKQFIEQNKNKLFDFLKDTLKNKLLQFTVIVDENIKRAPPKEPHLNSTEQLQKMIELYPAVKDLKDKLDLDIDY